MAKSVNKVILLGNLGKDPEVRFTGGGTAVASFTMATSSSYKDKTSGDWKETTEWHNIVAWQRLAEIARDYLKKGNKVYVEGRLQTRKWQDKEGKDRYTTEIVANELVLLGGRNADTGEGGGHSRGASSGNNFDQSAPDFESAPAAAHGTEITDDDIPF